MTFTLGDPNHIPYHNALVAQIQEMADQRMVDVTLPPVRALGASGHTDDHNLIVAAIEAIAAADLPPAAVDGVTGSPATGDVTHEDVTYDYWKFTADGTITFDQAGFVDVVVVGAGGPGGDLGGGGGGVITRRVYVDAATYAVKVGAGRGGGTYTNGHPSAFADLIALGGGYGAVTGNPGGSAGTGGGGNTTAAPLIPGQGYSGSASGAGGGAGGAAAGTTPGVGLTTWAGTFGAGGYSGTPSANTGGGGAAGNGSSAAGVVWVGIRRP